MYCAQLEEKIRCFVLGGGGGGGFFCIFMLIPTKL